MEPCTRRKPKLTRQKNITDSYSGTTEDHAILRYAQDKLPPLTSKFGWHSGKVSSFRVARRQVPAFADASQAFTTELKMLKIEHLNSGYGDIQVLWDISLEVREGEVVALIGSNGAGKSTLLWTISGLLKPTSGGITFTGERIDGVSPDHIVSRGITQVPQGRRLFPGLTVRENLLQGAYSRDDVAGAREDMDFVLTLFPRMKERINQPAGSLSGGEQQMCAVARGLMARPKLLMVDELSLGLAPIVVEAIYAAIVLVRQRGMTVFVVEQDVQLALEQADRGYVLDVGHLVMSGTSQELMENPRIKETYLGI
jgi:branched-chain amino acid transport system ATP-binding protein